MLTIFSLIQFLIILIVITIKSSDAIQCYRCQSIGEFRKECDDTFDENQLGVTKRDCPPDEACAKISGYRRNGDRMLIRDCYKLISGNPNEQFRHSCLDYYGERLDGWISLCDDELCNRFTNPVLNPVLIFVMIAIRVVMATS